MENSSFQTSRNIFKNVIYGFSTWLLPIGLSFIATPIIVRSLGNEIYGIYALIMGFIGYSFNFNTGRAITKYVAEYRVSGKTQEINEVIATTLLLNIFVGMFGAASIILLAGFLVENVFLIDPQARMQTVYAFYIAALIIFLTMLNQVFNSILQGIHRFDIYSKVFNLNSLLIISGNIILALSGFGLLYLLTWNLIVLVLIGIILFVLTKKILPEFRFSFGFKKEILVKITKFSAGLIGYQILSNFLLLFERSWIIRKLGEENLTFYVVPMILSLFIHSFITSLLLVIFPLASELENNREKLKQLYLKATKIVCFLVVFLALTLIVNSRLFLTLWMGEAFADESWYLLVIHTGTFSVAAILIVSWQMTEGLGYTAYNCFIYSFCLIISLSLMVWLIDGYGSFGVGLGRLIGFTVLCFSIFYVEKWFFKKVQIKFWLKTTGILGVASVIAGFMEYLVITRLSVSWITLFISVISGGLAYCLVLLLLGYIDEEDKLLLKKILNR